jgi:hypothetical protein
MELRHLTQPTFVQEMEGHALACLRRQVPPGDLYAENFNYAGMESERMFQH